MIEAQFGDGAAYGMNIEYSFDGPQLLGTGGALKRALPALGRSVLCHLWRLLPAHQLRESRTSFPWFW